MQSVVSVRPSVFTLSFQVILNLDFFTCARVMTIGSESVPIQLAQCWFPGLAISNAKILIYFSNKIYGSNFIEQHSETVMV